MGEFTEKTKGLGNELAGTVKTSVGKMTDNPKLQAEGEIQHAKGQAQHIKGSVEGAMGDKV